MNTEELEKQEVETPVEPATETPAEPANAGENGGSLAEHIGGEEGLAETPNEKEWTPEKICEEFDIPLEDEDGNPVSPINAIGSYIGSERVINGALVEALESEPVFAAFAKDVVNGASFEEAIIMNCDVQALAEKAANGERPDRSGFRAALDERKKRYNDYKAQVEADEKERNDFQAELEKNGAEFKEMYNGFCAEHNLDEKAQDELIKKTGELLSDVHRLKISRDVLQMVYDSMRMDEIREEAREAGVIEGRNQRIETMRKKKTENDGLPSIGSSTNKANMGEKPKSGIENFLSIIK